MYFNLIIAGFGGQGVLLAGKVLVQAAIYEGKHVTWLPSYGPEMRGGTANCTIVVSDEEIGSPITGNPMNAIVLNLPSKEKFESLIKPGGIQLINSSLIEESPKRNDLQNFCIPLNKIAEELGQPRALNIVSLGAFIEKSKLIQHDNTKKAIEVLFNKKAEFIDINKKAYDLGVQYAQNTQCAHCC